MPKFRTWNRCIAASVAAIAATTATLAEERVLHVCNPPAAGSECGFDSLNGAIEVAQPGDTILLAPGIYREAAVITVAGITIKGAPGAHLQDRTAEGKAALVIRADGVTVDGIECSGIKVPDRNGACIRAEGRDLVIKNVHFHDNQEGVLGSALAGGRLIIENSLFERNGFNRGFAHGVYIARETDLFIFRGNRLLATKDEGQGVKSRAKATLIEGNVIASLDARDSRAIDIPNGGEVVIRGNVLQKGPNSANSEMIGLGLEGNLHEDGSALIEGNIVLFDPALPGWVATINEYVPLAPPRGTMLHSRMTGEVVLKDNVVVGAANLVVGNQALELGNLLYDSRRSAGIVAAPELPGVQIQPTQ